MQLISHANNIREKPKLIINNPPWIIILSSSQFDIHITKHNFRCRQHKYQSFKRNKIKVFCNFHQRKVFSFHAIQKNNEWWNLPFVCPSWILSPKQPFLSWFLLEAFSWNFPLVPKVFQQSWTENKIYFEPICLHDSTLRNSLLYLCRSLYEYFVRDNSI